MNQATVYPICICSACGEVFLSSNTFEEALDEMRATWGEIPADDRRIVCGDCAPKAIQALAVGDA